MRVHPMWLARYLVLMGGALMGALGIAHAAAQLTPAELSALPPDQMRAYLLARVAEQRKTSAANAIAGLDATPPVLTKFSAPTHIRAGETIGIRYEASDDTSGVLTFYAFIAASKSYNRWGTAHDWRTYPSKMVHGTAGLKIDAYAPTDTYFVQDVYVADAAGNYRHYSGSELQALGNTLIDVRNPMGDDNTAPTLVKGRVLTPTVSLSTMQEGTNRPMWAGAQLDVADSGDWVSGPLQATTTFCKTDGGTCLSFTGGVFEARKRRATFEMGQSLGQATSTGVYKLRYVDIVDWAQNSISLESKEFGGSTDFSKYFPITTLTVVP